MDLRAYNPVIIPILLIGPVEAQDDSADSQEVEGLGCERVVADCTALARVCAAVLTWLQGLGERPVVEVLVCGCP